MKTSNRIKLSLVAGLSALASFASFTPVAQAEVVGGIEKLPTGHVPVLLSSVFDKRPERLGGGEKVAGLQIKAQSQGRRGRMGDITYVQLNDESNAGTCFRSSDGSEFNRQSKGVPATPAFRPFFEDALHLMATEWSRDGESMVPAHVSVARRERLVVTGDDSAKLDITDFWFDPVTRGARLIKSYEVPLRAIGKGLEDGKVYAMRDGDDFAIVIGRSKSDNGGDGILADDDRFSTRCGHATVTLSASEATGTSSMVTMDELVSVRTEAPTVKEAKARTEEAPSVLAKFVNVGAKLRPAFKSDDGDELPMVERVNRTFRLSVGVSQLGADKSPVLSVSRSWVGSEVGSPFEGVE